MDVVLGSAYKTLSARELLLRKISEICCSDGASEHRSVGLSIRASLVDHLFNYGHKYRTTVRGLVVKYSRWGTSRCTSRGAG